MMSVGELVDRIHNIIVVEVRGQPLVWFFALHLVGDRVDLFATVYIGVQGFFCILLHLHLTLHGFWTSEVRCSLWQVLYH